VDIANNDNEEALVRLCAASVRVGWNDKRVQAVLRKTSSDEHPLEQSRIRRLKWAARVM
jgi:hypothetical protein